MEMERQVAQMAQDPDYQYSTLGEDAINAFEIQPCLSASQCCSVAG
jgi:hypothetical protein